MIETYRRLYQAVAQGLRFTPEMRIANRGVTCYAIQQAREVMNFVYHAAGATAIFESNPFERRFRDLHTVTQQGQGQFSNFENLGATLMGRAATRRRDRRSFRGARARTRNPGSIAPLLGSGFRVRRFCGARNDAEIVCAATTAPAR